ncbi:MAG: peptidoglycan DD-metalloendopeptidase family protein, partial [Pseudomonadota bacterium]
NEVRSLSFDQKTLSEKKATLDALRNAYAAQKELLKHQQTERQAVLNQLQTQISNTQKHLTVRKKEQWELEQVLMTLHNRKPAQDKRLDVPTAKGFQALKGRLAPPIKGYKLLGHESKTSLLSCPQGTEIRAVQEGQVIFAEWLRGYGLLLIVDHGEGYISLYGHNEAVFKQVGDTVNTHDVIAQAGN